MCTSKIQYIDYDNCNHLWMTLFKMIIYMYIAYIQDTIYWTWQLQPFTNDIIQDDYIYVCCAHPRHNTLIMIIESIYEWYYPRWLNICTLIMIIEAIYERHYPWWLDICILTMAARNVYNYYVHLRHDILITMTITIHEWQYPRRLNICLLTTTIG